MAKLGLPGISSKLPADVRQFLERVREAFNGGSGTLVTYDDLRNAGIARLGRGGNLTLPEGSNVLNLTPPPAPTGLTASGAMTNIMLEWDAPLYGHHSHTEIWASGVDDIGQRVMVGTSQGSLYAHAVGTAETRYYWIRFVSKANIEGPFNGIAGTLGETSQDPAFLLSVLTGQLSESQLIADLNTRIDLIDAADTVTGSVAYRVAAEAADRAQALTSEATSRANAITAEADLRIAGDAAEALARGNAITAEVDGRTAAISNLNTQIQLDLAAGDNAVVSSVTSAYQAADSVTLASAQSYTYSKAQTDSAIAASATNLSAEYTLADSTTLASAQNFTYSRAMIDSADAATLSTLRSEFADADSVTLASAQSYTYSQAGINSAIATSADTLRTQYSGGYTGTDINVLSSGLLYSERVTRAAEDAALSQQITLLSAGAGEQFDYSNIWYFDSTAESWSTPTAGTTLSVVAGWLRLAGTSGAVSDANFMSPDNLNIDGAKYPQVRLRVRKIGNPTWEGRVYFTTTADNIWAEAKSAVIAEPSYDSNGISVVTFDMPAGWTGATVRQIRVDTSTSVTTTDYYELDWVAVGRPSPGASSAQLVAEEIARADGDSAQTTARETLAAQLRGGYTGTNLADLSSGLVASERDARVTAVSAEATSRTALATQLRGNYTGSTLTSLSSGLLYDERQARSTADATEVTARQSLSAKLTGSNDPSALTLATLSSGLIFDEKTVRASEDAVVAESVSVLSSQVNHGTSGLPAAHSAITTEATARADGDSAEVTARQALSAKLTGLNDPASATLANLASGLLFDERTARTSADGSQVTRIEGLEATVNNPTTGVAATANALDTVELLVNSGTNGNVALASGVSLLSSKIDKIRTWENTANVNGNDAALVFAYLKDADGTTNLKTADGVFGSSKGRVSYKVTARVIATGTPSGAVSIFTSTWDGAAWVWSQTLIHEAGVSSNHVRLYLDSGLPAVRLYNHTVTYNVTYHVEAEIAGYSSAAAILSEARTRASEDDVLAQSIQTVSARLNSGGDVGSAIITAQNTATTAVNNAATAGDKADAAQGTANTKIKTFYQTTAPTATTTGDLWVDTDDNNHLYRWSGSAWVDAHDARITSTASAVTTLQTTVGDHTTSIQTNAQSIDGVLGKYTVKIDNNGYVTGYGLISALNNGTPTSEFAIVADQFSIAPVNTDNTLEDGSPFFHRTTSTVINGVTVPAGTYMKSAYIHDASITNAKIANLAVDSAKIASLSAVKITAGSIGVGEYIQSTGYVSGLSGWKISGNGNLEANQGVFRGALYAATGTFGGSLLAGVIDFTTYEGEHASYGPGTYTLTVPSGKTAMRVTLKGGGGGGQYAYSTVCDTTTIGGYGGGGCGTVEATFTGLTAGATYTLYVGAAGAGGYGSGVHPNITFTNAGAGGTTWLKRNSDNAAVASCTGGGAGTATVGGSAGTNGTGGTKPNGGATNGGHGSAATFYDEFWCSNGDSMEIHYANGGNGGAGSAVVEFYVPNSVVLQTSYQTLLTALTRQGIATV